MSLKRICGIALWRGAAIGALATNLRCETESRRRGEWTSRRHLARWSALQSQPSSGCCCCACMEARSAYPPRHCETGFVFSLLQPGHRQEQKLIFTSLPWHVDLVGPCASRISLAGGCLPPFDFPLMFYLSFFFSLVHLEENAGDVIQCMAGRILGRLLHSNGGARSHASFLH